MNVSSAFKYHHIIQGNGLGYGTAVDILKNAEFSTYGIILATCGTQNTLKSLNNANGRKPITLESSQNQYKLTLISSYKYLQSFPQFQYMCTLSLR